MEQREADRRTNHILKHEGLYRAFPIFQKMVDHTVYISREEKMASQRAVDNRYGSVLVDQAEQNAHGA